MNSSALYRRLLHYIKPYRRIFMLAVGGMTLSAVAEPALPALLKPLLDGGFVNQDPHIITWTPVLLIVIGFLRGAGGFISAVGMSWVASHLVRDLRYAMFEKLLTLPAKQFDEISTGVLLSKITYDVNRVMQAGTDVLVVLIRDSLTVLGLLGWMFYVNWRLTLIVLIVTPVAALMIKAMSKQLRRINLSMQASMGEMTRILEEAIQGHKLVKVFAGQDYERRRFNQTGSDICKREIKIQVFSNISMFSIQFLIALALAAIVFIATLQSSAVQVTVGGFVSLFAAMGMLFSPVKRLTKVNEHLQQGLAAAQSVFELLDKDSEPEQGTVKPSRLSGEIIFENVKFAYESEPLVLDGVDLRIAPGEMIALVGASGGGKSSLANLAPRFYSLLSGRILMDGMDISRFPLAQLRANISLDSQEVVLFNDTIAANIAYGALGRASFQTVRAAASDACALDFIEAMPQGFNTMIGERGVKLSGGQRQRLAIARALLKEAPILIFDEASSALDGQTERCLQASLEKLHGRRTIILIAHRLSTIERADRIVVMSNGRIVESGSHYELLSKAGVYSQLYHAQAAYPAH